MSVHVLAPGLLSTIQDRGRSGWRHLGVGTAGALDGFSHAVANRLVGNDEEAATIEVSLHGPRLRFDTAARIALCGAVIDAEAEGVALPGWRPVDLPAGTVLELGPCRRGARVSLAVAGGFAMPCVLGSTSTDLRGGFGGMRGRALAAGDVLPVRAGYAPAVAQVSIARWWIDPTPDLDFDRTTVVRVLPGQQLAEPGNAMLSSPWRVAPASNRQGLRLKGEPLHLAARREAVSEPVAPGTIQLPPDGLPIILLADAQTHGGYPRIGHAIRADWPRLAQLRPGDLVHFEACTRGEARRLACEQRHRLARIGHAIAARHASP